MKIDRETAERELGKTLENIDREGIEEELRHWFFDVYFNHWVDIAAGRRTESHDFILDYWGTPMYVTIDSPEIAVWMLEGQEIIDFLALQHEMLKAGGYDHTEVPDQRVLVYNQVGGAIEVIWSRQAADNSELQRFVVHFECAKINGEKWKVVGMQSRQSSGDKDQGSIEKAWAQ